MNPKLTSRALWAALTGRRNENCRNLVGRHEGAHVNARPAPLLLPNLANCAEAELSIAPCVGLAMAVVTEMAST